MATDERASRLSDHRDSSVIARRLLIHAADRLSQHG
jgi:hypothetical protein